MTTDTSTTDPPAAPAPPGPGVAPGGAGVPARTPATRPVVAYLAAGSVYLVLAVAIWWNVWSAHPTSTATSLSGDGPLFTWFLEWPAYALAHGLDPLYSTALFHPGGVNLLANTGVVGIGVVLAPVTWAFGPVATLNLALTLSPVLSALAMFALLRRWVTWAPAAFVGGLCYGFSPFVLAALADDHLMFGFAALPPLIVACLDELLVRRRRRPGPTGVVLGLLVTAQFFVGTEALVMTAVGCLVGVVLLAGFTAARRPEEFRRQRHRAAVGLGAGAATALVLLAYPVWFALAGPAHFSGPIWPGLDLPHGGTSLHLLAFPQSREAVVAGRGIYGLFYEGPLWSYEYVGLGLVAVVVVGAAVWWRDALIRLFGSVAVVSVVLSLGESHTVALPWALARRAPHRRRHHPRPVPVAHLAVPGRPARRDRRPHPLGPPAGSGPRTGGDRRPAAVDGPRRRCRGRPGRPGAVGRLPRPRRPPRGPARRGAHLVEAGRPGGRPAVGGARARRRRSPPCRGPCCGRR